VRLIQDLVGERLGGRYHLVVRLAGGGMGEVYRAHDGLLDRVVAVKVLQPELASDPVLVERFRNEARAAARLGHPNVVAVHDWGSEGERTYFMVMEYVAGTDLRDVLVGRGCLEPAQAAEIVASVCDALGAAHSCGLVHRDVKPENVLLDRDGTVKVADFGIAVVTDIDRTMPGGVIPGTLRYLSPEQAQGFAATPASDLWAAGAVLAELLTGHPPLQGAGADFLQRRASEAPVPPSQVDTRVPPELDEIVLRACALDPADRYGDAGEMANALRRVAVRSLGAAAPVDSLVWDVTDEIRLPETAPATRMGRRRRRRRAYRVLGWALLLALLASGAGAAGYYFVLARPTTVPDIVGDSQRDAERALGRAGLVLEVDGRERHFGTRQGEVLAQEPTSGVLREGSAVRVVVSAGLPEVLVPSLRGLPVDGAGERLRLVGLELGRVDDSYSARKRGTVISQSPSEGDLSWGGAVDVVVSKGPRPAAVASVQGLPARRARARLARAGFEVVLERSYSNSIEAGKAVGTTPSAGAILPGGSKVTLVVSRGPRFAELRMPDVRHSSIPEARAKLADLALRARVVPTCEGGSTVVETDPIQGSRLREHDLVALFVC
jgi:beta-lactam-binding protein with PASTA domain